MFEFSENGSLPPPGTRTTPDKVIVDSTLSKRREKHSHDTGKCNSQCEFAPSFHFSSQTTATTQTISSSSTIVEKVHSIHRCVRPLDLILHYVRPH